MLALEQMIQDTRSIRLMVRVSFLPEPTAAGNFKVMLSSFIQQSHLKPEVQETFQNASYEGLDWCVEVAGRLDLGMVDVSYTETTEGISVRLEGADNIFATAGLPPEEERAAQFRMTVIKHGVDDVQISDDGRSLTLLKKP